MKKIFLFILVLSPIFWWTLVYNFPKLIHELSRTPHYVANQKDTIFSVDNLKKVEDLRWYDQTNHLNQYSPVFFNKATVIVNQVFEGYGNFGPKTFFFSGDSFGGNPKAIEPIPFVLLPITFLGLLRLVKNRHPSVFVFLAFVLIPLLTGQPTLFFLFPVGLFYLFAAAHELSFWKSKQQTKFLIAFTIYSIFLICRLSL